MTEQTISKPTRRYARDPKPQTEAAPKLAADKTLPAQSETRIGAVTALLQREQGATLDEMIKATGWLPHTTRAALTGLKKRATRSSATSAARQPATASLRAPDHGKAR